ncbi:hypothetical protein PoB_007675300 [Plakobranchus ocellatus]|uniref:Uncharacterized protein n=1 Tax=Plakobranchus ocellatus TaxID=259542 RepID=A0AAV4E0W6_9GAST|nr:hypothetical protein PoB_007675300 [Plakobranchus ocellatus]
MSVHDFSRPPPGYMSWICPPDSRHSTPSPRLDTPRQPAVPMRYLVYLPRIYSQEIPVFPPPQHYSPNPPNSPLYKALYDRIVDIQNNMFRAALNPNSVSIIIVSPL